MIKKEIDIQKLAESFIATKNNKTFSDLFYRLKPGISNRCFLILKDTELAEDAFINTMSKIWQKVDQYDIEKANFSTWCYNIAKNESLLIMKSRKRIVRQEEIGIELMSSKNPLQELGGIYSLEEDPNYIFKEGNNIDAIYESVLEEILELPDLYREIMVDREINGMKYKDIANKYGIKKRSIATRIRRARGKIKRKVDEYNKIKMKKI